MADAILERSARQLVLRAIGNYPRINAELCQFADGVPVTVPATGSRIEELYTDLNILTLHANGQIGLNVKVDGNTVLWNW